MTAAKPLSRTSPDSGEGEAYGMVLGKVVAQMRDARGITQSDLAARVGISQSALSKIESGKRPDAYVFGNLARAFGMDVQQLDSKVHAAMDQAREVAAKVAGKKASSSWAEFVALAGFVGLVAFVVAALLENGDGKPGKPPSTK